MAVLSSSILLKKRFWVILTVGETSDVTKERKKKDLEQEFRECGVAVQTLNSMLHSLGFPVMN